MQWYRNNYKRAFSEEMKLMKALISNVYMMIVRVGELQDGASNRFATLNLIFSEELVRCDFWLRRQLPQPEVTSN